MVIRRLLWRAPVVVLLSMACIAEMLHLLARGSVSDALRSVHRNIHDPGTDAVPVGIHGRDDLPTSADVVIPFDLVAGHIFVRATINGSRLLSFIFDTGDKYAIVDLALARELGLSLGGVVGVAGTGAKSTQGAFVKGATFSLVGLDSLSQSITLAIPVRALASRLGRDVDGVIGADFISQFVVEVDYAQRSLVLHDRDRFVYSGTGQIVPVVINANGHPSFEAAIDLEGRGPIQGRFDLDLGSNTAIQLHSPFVVDNHLPYLGMKTVRGLGAFGTGGASVGWFARVQSLTIGLTRLNGPEAFLSEDAAGALSSQAEIGTIGEQIASRFKLLLDYHHSRIIFEPTALTGEPFRRVSGGIVFEATGQNYRTFRVVDLIEPSPATEAKLQRGDTIVAINGTPASQLTLTQVLETLERPTTCTLVISRGATMFSVTLTPRVIL